MYEINLVPDVKAELLLKQKLRNLVILICIAAGAACVVVVITLAGVVAGQAITMAGLDGEIDCRATGKGKCDSSKTGTPVSKFENLDTLLTMRDQMSILSVLNSNRLNMSRVFPMFDVILPEDKEQGTVKISMADIDFGSMRFTINANSDNSTSFSAREAFGKNLRLTYFDYGSYMRKDKSTNEWVEIPSYCITEIVENGIQYGIYSKGKAGCEKPLFEKDDGEDKEEKTDEDEDSEEDDIVEIKIRRTYENESDRDSYKSGQDKYAQEGDEKISGYYFESKCIQYDGEGTFSEDETLETCGLLVDNTLELESGSFSKGDGGNMVLSFAASFNLNKNAFYARNKHVIFVGPTKRNVTDSYVPVRDIFSKGVVDNGENK